MMKGKTDLFENASNQRNSECKGNRCHICTGCGACFDKKRDLRTVFPESAEQPFFGNGKEPYIAVDLGTTTIAFVLVAPDGEILSTAACENPQRSYGADVIRRIQNASDKRTAMELKNRVQREIALQAERFREALKERGAGFSDTDLKKGYLAGNTTMTYLLMGDNPEELGKAPFCVSHPESRHLFLGGIDFYIFPGLSAFVGGDLVAGAWGLELTKGPGIRLLVDLGTNGEILMGCPEGILATATAAGPAFEGGSNKGTWGADVVHLCAELRRRNLVDAEGLLAEPYFEKGIRIGNAEITTKGIRELQLAKGAVLTGIRTLLKRWNLTENDIDTVYLAGGFGYFLEPADAEAIGLLPKGLIGKCVAPGNSSLLGAMRLGSTGENTDQRRRAEDFFSHMPKGIEVINLAEREDFSKQYLEALRLEPYEL